MEAKTANRYVDQPVKIVKNHFALYGKIIAVEGDCIIFQTKDKTSVISLKIIDEIMPMGGE